MIKIFPTSHFSQSFRRLPSSIQKLADQKTQLFRKDPFDSRLKTHKLKGRLSRLSSFSVNYQYRILFKFIDQEKVLFYDIGTHQIYR